MDTYRCAHIGQHPYLLSFRPDGFDRSLTLLRESLVRLFRKQPDLLVVGQGGQSETTSCHVIDTKFEVLVTDSFPTARLPANLALQIRREGTLRALLIGMEADEEQFLAAVRFGVTGYLLQDASGSDVVAAVRAVFRGEAVCPARLSFALFRIVAQAPRGLSLQSSNVRPHLTLRQQQLVALVAKGLTNKEIASHLNLSAFTVRNHIHRILKQVDAESRSQSVEVIRAYSYAVNI
ncbi:MAG: response regulator transcription factor [Candidatus Sulfotelmatobacter sp.]